MSDLGNFNADEHKNKKFDPIPKGDYSVIAIGSQMKDNKKKTGTYMEMQFQVLDGQYQNRRFFKRFNWTTTKTDDGAKKGVQIGKGQFSELCRAVGIITPKDSAELHNIPVIARIKIEKGNDEFPDDKNEIYGFKPIDPSKGPTSSGNGGAAAQPPVNAGAAPAGKPW